MTELSKNNTKSRSKWLSLNSANFLIAGATLGLTWAYFVPHNVVEYEVTQVTPLLNADAKSSDISVNYHEQTVEDPHLVEVKITNAGNRAIKEDDYTDAFAGSDRGLEMRFLDSSVTVLSASVEDVLPANRKIFTVSLDGDTEEKSGGSHVLLPAISLNPGDSYSVKLLVDRRPIATELIGHIFNCQLKRTEQGNWKCEWPNHWNPLIAAFFGLCTGGLIYKLLDWYRRVRLGLNWIWRYTRIHYWVAKKKIGPEEATAYLVNNEKFNVLCQNLSVINNDQKELLRAELTKLIGDVSMEPDSTVSINADVSSESSENTGSECFVSIPSQSVQDAKSKK